MDLKASMPASMSVICTPNSDSSATTTSKAAIESTPRFISDVSSPMFAASTEPPVAFEIITFNWSFNAASANLIHHLPIQIFPAKARKRVIIHVFGKSYSYLHNSVEATVTSSMAQRPKIEKLRREQYRNRFFLQKKTSLLRLAGGDNQYIAGARHFP